MFRVVYSNQAKRDLRKSKKQGLSLSLFIDVVEKIANNEQLEQKYKNHKLTGNYKNCYECHISLNWLMIYQKDNVIRVVRIERIGSHSELFNQ